MNERARPATRELSPAQHRAIQQQIFLIPIYLWALYIWQVFVQQLPFAWFGDTAKIFRDFAHFYILGTIARVGDASLLYDVPGQNALLQAHVPGYVDVAFPPSYGPQVALIFRPFAALPYVPALIAWMGVTLVIYLAAAWLVWRECPHLRDKKWPLLPLLSASPALHMTLMYGQTTALATLCFATAFVCLQRKRTFLAGLAIGGLFYKPQLGLAAAILFVAAGEWRTVAGAIASSAVQMGVAAVYWGPSVLNSYARALSRIPSTVALIEPDKRQLHAWRAFFQLAGVEGDRLLIATIVASLLTVAAAVVCWRRTTDLRLRFTVLLAATALINPHMYVYDLIVLTPLGLVVWDYLADSRTAPRVARGLAVALLALFASPVLGFMASSTTPQMSVIVLAALTASSAALSFRAAPLLTFARGRAAAHSSKFPL